MTIKVTLGLRSNINVSNDSTMYRCTVFLNMNVITSYMSMKLKRFKSLIYWLPSLGKFDHWGLYLNKLDPQGNAPCRISQVLSSTTYIV